MARKNLSDIQPTGLTFFAGRTAALTTYVQATPIPFDTKVIDTTGWFDITTNIGRFTPLLAGAWHLGGQINVPTSIATGQYIILGLQRNGGQIAELGRLATNGAVNPSASGSAIVTANGTTDYFNLIFQGTPGGNATIQNVSSGSHYSYFWGNYLGRIT